MVFESILGIGFHSKVTFVIYANTIARHKRTTSWVQSVLLRRILKATGPGKAVCLEALPQRSAGPTILGRVVRLISASFALSVWRQESCLLRGTTDD